MMRVLSYGRAPSHSTKWWVYLMVLTGLVARPTAQAEMIGPPVPFRSIAPPVTWMSDRFGPSLRVPPADILGEALEFRLQAHRGPAFEGDAPTIDRASGEEKGPRIPEPMVFDLVRPLGAGRGEAEFNTLGLVPLTRKTRRVDDVTDPLGLVRRSPDTQGVEWAPEVEFVLTDGLAFELELPLENGSVEAYKVAGQATFGTLWDHRFIHGAQVIAQYDRQPGTWTTTWLYLAGARLNNLWSLFGMVGPRFEHGSPVGGRHAEILGNVTLFADITDRWVGGVEMNVGQVLDGSGSLLVMPQVHYEVDSHWMVQAGVGARVIDDAILAEIGFRLIREF
jgi:hypothetical protein